MLTFRAVSSDNWHDFERLFASKGGPKYCWCMVFRENTIEPGATDGASRKASMKQRVQEGVPVGLLAYVEGETVGWCSIAPRATFVRLRGDESKENVWSLTCFFIRREYRGKGLASQLLNEAIRHAGENGANYLEAYPVEPDSPSYRFMGFKPMFEKAGFFFIKMAGSRRNVMVLPLG